MDVQMHHSRRQGPARVALCVALCVAATGVAAIAVAGPAPAAAAASVAAPRLTQPQAHAIVVTESEGRTVVHDPGRQPPWRSSDGMIWPVKGRATSEFGHRGGRMHNGIDIAADTGTPIVAADAGRVTFSGWQGGYGMTIDVDHGGGIVTRYAHQSAMVVSEGDVVARGERIGRVGTTGSSTGPHLHFEVRIDDAPHDPRIALSSEGARRIARGSRHDGPGIS